MASETRGARIPPEFSQGPKNAQGALQKSLRERFRRHLSRSCVLIPPVSLHKSASDAFWAPHAPRRSQRRYFGVSGGLLGGSWVNSASWKGLGMVLGPFWYHSEPIFITHFAPHVGPIFHVLGAILNEFSLRTFFAGRETRKRHQRQESTSETEEASRREGRRDPEGCRIWPHEKLEV